MAGAGFDDGKDPGALRTIGEVAKGLGIKQHVLRYWEKQFPMLRPLQRSGNRRYYRPEDIELVHTINRLVNREGYTLRGARQAIEHGHADVGADSRGAGGTGAAAPAGGSEDSARSSVPGDSPADVPADVLASLKAIRSRLASALDG